MKAHKNGPYEHSKWNIVWTLHIGCATFWTPFRIRRSLRCSTVQPSFLVVQLRCCTVEQNFFRANFCTSKFEVSAANFLGNYSHEPSANKQARVSVCVRFALENFSCVLNLDRSIFIPVASNPEQFTLPLTLPLTSPPVHHQLPAIRRPPTIGNEQPAARFQEWGGSCATRGAEGDQLPGEAILANGRRSVVVEELLPRLLLGQCLSVRLVRPQLLGGQKVEPVRQANLPRQHQDGDGHTRPVPGPRSECGLHQGRNVHRAVPGTRTEASRRNSAGQIEASTGASTARTRGFTPAMKWSKVRMFSSATQSTMFKTL